MELYHFRLTFSAAIPRAFFPFVADGAPLPGMGCALSSRFAGNMVYSGGANSPIRDRFYRSLGLEPERVFACTQIHSRKTLEIGRNSPNAGPEADGMVCREPGLCLSVTVADCLPVFLYDRETGAFGLVHSGWRGTGIVLAALELMEERWGVRAEDVAAVLGPCIQGCCYQVDRERAAAFEAEFGGEGPLGPVIRGVPSPGEDGERIYYLDLPAANVRLLAKAGVRHIAVCDDCTFMDQRLGSFRREGADYTRMAALIGPLIPASG